MRYYLALDVGGTFIKGGRLKPNGYVEEALSIPTRGESNKAFVNSLIEALEKLSLDTPPEGIGVGVPGPVDIEKGKILYSANLNVRNLPVISSLKKWSLKKWGKDIFISMNNDGNCYALGIYYFHYKKRYPTLATLTLGTGIGGGLIWNHRLYNGYKGNAFEIGHSVFADDSFPPKEYPLFTCGCGSKGCLETFASATAVVNYYHYFQGLKKKKYTAKEIYQLALQGERAALKAFQIAGEALGCAIVSLVHILNIPLIVISGGLASAKKFLQPGIKKILDKRLFPLFKRQTRVVFIPITKHMGIQGAFTLTLYEKLLL